MEYPAENRSKMIRDVSDEGLRLEYKYWQYQIETATSWGAALVAADEFCRKCKLEMDRRGLK